jgi:Immune inhibitor A peptidase M6
LNRPQARLRTRTLGLSTLVAIVGLSVITGVAAASSSDISFAAKKVTSSAAGKGTIHLAPTRRAYPLKVGNKVITPKQLRRMQRLLRARSKSRGFRAQSHTPVLGEVRNWVGLDDVAGAFYRKGYTLRGVGNNIEVWVASERRTFAGITSSATDFQDGDCRNGVRTQITDAQVNYLIDEFDNNILPKESEAFSIAPNRDGSHALLGAPFHPGGEGDNTVVLIDNVRDDNFYDLNNTQNFSYIAGFFSSQLNTLFDRNIMSIDAFDWLHRTGANPPHEPVPGNNCTSAPARPFLYEGVFAHEYQHLLESYADSDGETNWINEGLSDHAQTITGYVNPATPITQIGFDSHTQCFLGYLGVQTAANPNPRAGGPENSLTRWEDQGPGEILCDYGAAYTMMEYLHGRFGTAFMRALHNGEANGLAGVEEALGTIGNTGSTAQGLVHNWSVMVAVDGLIDDGARILGPYSERLFTAPTLDASINWDTSHAYDTPGTPSNGADYVRLRNAAGSYVSGRGINSLSFTGATTLPPLPMQWTVAADPPFTPGDPALFSGAGNNRDEAIVREITVPSGAGASLTFEALWNEELGWDFLFAQISTDGGETYSSLTCTDTTTVTNPDALPTAKENVPGFTGYSGGWKPQTCSLSAYAGQTVLLAFRTFNDPAVLGESTAVPPGAWVDDVRVGGTLVSDGSSLVGWQSFTQVRPVPVAGFTVRIVSIDSGKGKITVKQLPLTGTFTVSGSANVQKYIDKNADFVGAIVMYDDPSESTTQYAPYRLTANGVTQPGGGM